MTDEKDAAREPDTRACLSECTVDNGNHMFGREAGSSCDRASASRRRNGRHVQARRVCRLCWEGRLLEQLDGKLEQRGLCAQQLGVANAVESDCRVEASSTVQQEK